MKFVHIADMHFDSPFVKLSDKDILGDLRRLEQRKVFKKIIEYIKNNNIKYFFISGDLYEASALDGANAIQTFFRITIPQLKPILVSLLMLDFVWTLQQFALIWMTTGGGPVNATETISTYIYKQGFTKYPYSMASAAAVILLIVCTIIGIFYVRQQRSED